MKPANWVWLGVMALSLWCTTGLAQPRFGTGPMGPGGIRGDDLGPPLPTILSGVDLTPAQQARLQKLMEANRATLRTLFSQLEAAHEEMAAQLLAPGVVDAAAVTAHIRHVTQLREQLMQAGLKVALEVRGVLTPDQLAKASQLQAGIKAVHTEMSHLFEERP